MPRPWTRRTLAVFLVVFFCVVLLVDAVVSTQVGASSTAHESHATDQVPRSIREGGPVIDTSGDRPLSLSMRERAIALTFDDGPDPTWTPQVLDVLRAHGAKATFFLVGARVTEHPELTRRIVAEGHELGLHTFTHPEMSSIPDWARRLQYAQTQAAIVGATGTSTTLLRFPYSSTASAIDNVYWPIIQEAGDLGYVTVVSELDSKDWARPGVNRIVANSTPPGTTGGVVLMHDAGGDRTQTVEALKVLVPELEKRGFEFTTISGGLAPADQAALTAPVHGGASTGAVWQGRSVIGVIAVAHWLVSALAVALLAVGALTVGRLLLVFVTVRRQVRRRRAAPPTAPVTASVSVIVPAYNESAGIAAAIRALVGSDYRDADGAPIEVVVVDDGSTDDTADVVRALGLPQVRLIQVPNQGKARALNIGTAAARGELIVMVDGDTLLEPDSVRLLVQPFADPRVGAVAGNVKVGNRNSLIGRWQHIEYVTGFALDRRMYEVLGCIATVPGALGAFRRAALTDVGGVSDATLAEDTDLTIAVTRSGWRVVAENRARAWTETPATLHQLWTQRYRWSYGTMQAMWKHRRAVVESGASGRFGRVGLPMLALFGVALPMLSPLIDVFLVYGLLFYDTSLTALGWVGMLTLQMVTAAVAFRLDRERLRTLWAFPLQQVVYRQLMYLVLIQSVLTAVAGVRLRWQKLHRTGDTAVLSEGS